MRPTPIHTFFAHTVCLLAQRVSVLVVGCAMCGSVSRALRLGGCGCRPAYILLAVTTLRFIDTCNLSQRCLCLLVTSSVQIECIGLAPAAVRAHRWMYAHCLAHRNRHLTCDFLVPVLAVGLVLVSALYSSVFGVDHTAVPTQESKPRRRILSINPSGGARQDNDDNDDAEAEAASVSRPFLMRVVPGLAAVALWSLEPSIKYGLRAMRCSSLTALTSLWADWPDAVSHPFASSHFTRS